MKVRVKSMESRSGKSIIARILPGCDITEGIKEVCRRHKVSAGAVVSGIGSLQYATFVYVVPDRAAPTGAKYDPPRKVEGPMELLGLQGTIGHNRQGGISAHLHGTIVDSQQHLYGGHLIASQNPVLVTAEVMICTVHDGALVKTKDRETNFELFNPKP